MKLITYTDEFGLSHVFDANRVMFTMSQPTGDVDEDGKFKKILTKVALNENMGFILADEDPDAMIARIKEANGIG